MITLHGFWRCLGTAFGNFLLGSHNFVVTALGSCVKLCKNCCSSLMLGHSCKNKQFQHEYCLLCKSEHIGGQSRGSVTKSNLENHDNLCRYACHVGLDIGWAGQHIWENCVRNHPIMIHSHLVNLPLLEKETQPIGYVMLWTLHFIIKCGLKSHNNTQCIVHVMVVFMDLVSK